VQVKALEDGVGIVLFDRSARPPVLTPSSHALLPRASKLAEPMIASIRSGVTRFSKGTCGFCRSSRRATARIHADWRVEYRTDPERSPTIRVAHVPGTSVLRLSNSHNPELTPVKALEMHPVMISHPELPDSLRALAWQMRL
jgi:hypothetical protein